MPTTNTFDATINEFADRVKQDRALAYGLVKYLEAIGVVDKVGDRPSTTGRGKPSGVYRFPKNVELKLDVPVMTKKVVAPEVA